MRYAGFAGRQREKIVSEMALIKRDRPSPRELSPKQVAYACERMRQMLLDRNAGCGKHLLTCLVDEMRVGTDLVTMTGSTAVLKQVVDEMKLGTSVEVPSIVVNWRAREDETGHWSEVVSLTCHATTTNIHDHQR